MATIKNRISTTQLADKNTAVGVLGEISDVDKDTAATGYIEHGGHVFLKTVAGKQGKFVVTLGYGSCVIRFEGQLQGVAFKEPVYV